ncbi:MAG TPA: hypothetical protein EYQ47_02320 [Cycloclasticus sp.]|nr:hypothetical protein [Cycloclasticus sp.]
MNLFNTLNAAKQINKPLKNLLPWADKWLADETRPRNQGSRLTLWELQKENIQATLIADNVTAS